MDAFIKLGVLLVKLKKKRGYHRHHIIPKHAGGDDSLENLVYLTPEEHAKAHFDLYEKYGKAEDAAAANMLLRHWLSGRTCSGYKQTPEHISKRISSMNYEDISKKLKGRKSPTTGMKFECSPEKRANISKSLKGKKFSEERKRKMSDAMKGNVPVNKIEFYCIFCKCRMAPSGMDRHGPGKAKCIPKET